MNGLVALMLIYLFAAALWVQKDISKVRITDKKTQRSGQYATGGHPKLQKEIK
jgi:hypothetical protein